MRLAASLKQRVHRWRGYRGNLDGLRDRTLIGWAQSFIPQDNPVRVGLFTRHGLLIETRANIFRRDLYEAGVGSGAHGFSIQLDSAALDEISKTGGELRLCVLGHPSYEIGRWDLQKGWLSGARRLRRGEKGVTLSDRLYGALIRLKGLRVEQEETGAVLSAQTLPPLLPHQLMFSRRDLVRDAGSGVQSGALLPAQMTSYGDYVRYRAREDLAFPLGQGQGDEAARDTEAEHFLFWYLDNYGALRTGLRAPLSAGQIAHLNAPVLIGGQRQGLSRALWMFLLQTPSLRAGMDFADPDWLERVIFWWARYQARDISAEDCLVTPEQIALLAEVPERFAGQDFALSRFLLRMAQDEPWLFDFDLSRPEGRREMILAALLISAQRPDYLRYIPKDSREALLAAPAGGVSAFSDYITRQAAKIGIASPAPVERAEFAALQRVNGFDLESGAFLSFTPAGDRIEAARLPVPQGDKVDVQLIGPFHKTSGLGQATRLSSAILTRAVQEGAPFSLNMVDFDLDNPAPSRGNRAPGLGRYRPARINILHLNAETVPLSFAYQPDILSGAYNIGYFYWELESPAACHYLGMELLDEIWVSSQYGVEIYQNGSKARVSNVGMSFETPPEIDRAEARAFLAGRCGIAEGDFVFLTTFDSYSFVQRKNPLGSVRAFRRAFAPDVPVRLVIKSHNRRKVIDPDHLRIWDEIDREMAADPRIRALDETLSYEDLLKLKRGSDAYVSLHRSEGWGFGMIEAMNLKLPVLATAYSGNLEFCTDKTAYLVGYRKLDLQRHDYIFVRPGQQWADPDEEDAARQMRLLYEDPALRQARVEAAWAYVQQNFSESAIAGRYAARLSEILRQISAGQTSAGHPSAGQTSAVQTSSVQTSVAQTSSVQTSMDQTSADQIFAGPAFAAQKSGGRP